MLIASLPQKTRCCLSTLITSRSSVISLTVRVLGTLTSIPDCNTGAVTPFIGLFGTVWGIIDAFHGLGTAGAATLRAVAPGISEALITTAAGLAAAIPAVIAYNLIGSSIREFAARGDDFALEMLNAVERAGVAVPEVRR